MVKKIAAALVVFITGAIGGGYVSSKGRFPVYQSKHFFNFKNQFLDISGEMVALDFAPGLRPRLVSLKCTRIDKGAVCLWAEFSYMLIGNVSSEIFTAESLESWDAKGNIRIRTSNDRFVRTIDISSENESLTETYKYTNGEIRTVKLVGSDDKRSETKRNLFLK